MTKKINPDEANDKAIISDERSHGFANVWLNEDTARAMIHRFQGDHFPKNPRLSKSVWISKEAIQYLANFLDKSTDGVRVYMASYDQMVVSSQRHLTQSTVVLVPTKGKVDDFNHIPKPEKYVLNHGDLCPNYCPGSIS